MVPGVKKPMIDESLHGTAAFVMPHFGDTPSSRHYLEAAIDSVRRQSDPDWRLIIVDDASPNPEDRQMLRGLSDERVTVLFQERRYGPGPARNAAIAAAAKSNAPFVLFLDSDDIASSDRLALTRAAFVQHADAGVVYSLFEAVDSAGAALAPSLLTPSIQVILRTLAQTPPTGPTAWIEMATTYGYSNLTSTTAVRTAIAAAVPFAAELVSDDLHTWFRYGGYGASFYCIPSVTCGYRIPDPAVGSSCRRRFGGGFYYEKARVDSDGLEQAFQLALAGGRLMPRDVPAIRQAFRERLAQELRAEGEAALAEALVGVAPDQVANPEIFVWSRTNRDVA